MVRFSRSSRGVMVICLLHSTHVVLRRVIHRDTAGDTEGVGSKISGGIDTSVENIEKLYGVQRRDNRGSVNSVHGRDQLGGVVVFYSKYVSSCLTGTARDVKSDMKKRGQTYHTW